MVNTNFPFKKVRSGRCFAAHLLSVSCAGFRQVVRRDGLEVGERVGECENALMV